MSLTHFDEKGRARMVDISGKDDTGRYAVAEGWIIMKDSTLKLVLDRQIAKGDVLETARLAGIMAAKKTDDLIPLCHSILISGVEVNLTPEPERSSIKITAKVSTTGKTGVEMDALTAVSVCALTVYDMVKSVDKEIVITDISLMEKSGGKSGHYLKNNGVS